MPYSLRRGLRASVLPPLAARGLCDAAAMAERRGEAELAAKYKKAGEDLRAAIATKLTDASGAIASTLDELEAGRGYYDAAVLDAIAMGLSDPKGKIDKGTLAAMDARLAAPAGAGWSRNDDHTDHPKAEDVSPWGSEYDSAEWVITDLRGAIATRLAGDSARSDRLIKWVREQSLANFLVVAETYDEVKGTYKFNAPRVGFGAGAFSLAEDPACGAYFAESTLPQGADRAASTGAAGSAAGGAGGAEPSAAGRRVDGTRRAARREHEAGVD